MLGHLQTKGFDESRERGRLLSPTRVVQKIAGERRAPIFEHPHECATRQAWRCLLFQHERQTDAIDRRTNHDLRIINQSLAVTVNGPLIVEPLSNSHRYTPADP
jgi:hypothetical protein